MPFCPNCKSMLFPVGGVLECKKCGYKGGKTESKVVTTAREERDVLVITPEDEAKLEIMPKMRAECPKCGNMEAYYRTQQTRKSDEPETAFLRCTKCGHRWRKY
jgi:transcription factor S